MGNRRLGALRQQNPHPVAPPHATFLAPWAAKVEKESGGKLKIQLFPSMQLGGTPPQLVDQIKDGVVDIGWTVTGYTAGRFPRKFASSIA